MELQDFTTALINELKRGDYFPNQDRMPEIQTTNLIKLNQGGKAIIIKTDENLGLQFDLNALHEEFEDRPIKEVADYIKNQIEMAKDSPERQIIRDTSWIGDFQKARSQLAVCVCDTERNQEFLKNVPYLAIPGAEPLALVAAIEGKPKLQAWVTKELIEKWGITREQLFQEALENSVRIRPCSVKQMSEVITDLVEEELPPSPLRIVTNQNTIHGASAIFYPGVLERLGAQLGDYFILPSSVHEVLVLPESEMLPGMEVKDLNAMVREINQTQVRPKEQLTDTAYHYQAKTKKLETAVAYEQRAKGLEKKPEVKGETACIRSFKK